MKRLALLWFAFLVIVALASTFTRAQTPQGDARILSGSDIGFRVEGTDRSGNPTGTFMVRINGKWFEARTSPALRPTTK